MATDVRGAHESGASNRTVRQLVSDLTGQLTRLVHTEIQLAQRELAQRGKKAGLGAAVLAFGAVLGLLGAGALVATAVLALALVLPAWAAGLVVGGVLVLAAGAIAAGGVLLLRRQVPPFPADAISGAKQDVEVIRQAMTRRPANGRSTQHGHVGAGEPERT